MNVPTRAYCGACHDNVNFATGANHTGGTQIDDSLCVSCHGAAGVQISHTPLVAPDAANFLPGSHTNGSYIATDVTNLKALGAHRVTWDLKSFSVNSAGNPVFLFRFLEDGQAKPFNTASSTVTSFWDNYVGGPSFYVALGVPQDGISSPADWNATANVYFPNVWNGSLASKATLSATPDSNGYYTLTMVGTVIPSGATQVTGGIGYVYSYSSMPLTQTAVKKFGQIDFTYNPVTKLGGLSVPAPNVFKTATGYTARRAIVDSAKCNSCHNSLGVFTKAVFHAGERNSAETCTFCHHANYVGDHGSDGWADNEKDMIHALHAAPVRNNYFSWQAANGATYWTTTWPGGDGPSMLNNCEVCHVPGSYDFSGTANAAAVPNLLWSTASIGTIPKVGDPASSTDSNPILSVSVAAPGNVTFDKYHLAISPWVVAGQSYGNAFSYNLATATPTPAAGTTLVHSPIASACFGCHDSQIDIAHFQNNGGSIYQPRSTAFNNVEQCLVCHGNGKVADIKAVHMNF
ncbi:MAG TPA: OmcA/MtrC family decaheme c-type cytochrome, partial [Holophagaceae bacterium]